MSTWVGVEIDGLSVEDYQNHHSTWFFKRSDRVRENCERDENGRLPDGAFIGFRASAATIRRRMALGGLDLAACETHFKESLSILLQEAKLALQKYQHPSYYTDENPYLASRAKEAVYAYPRFIHAVEGTSLADWISAFPPCTEDRN